MTKAIIRLATPYAISAFLLCLFNPWHYRFSDRLPIFLAIIIIGVVATTALKLMVGWLLRMMTPKEETA